MRARKIKINEKINFLSESEFIGKTNPGVGLYQPHDSRQQIKKNMTKPKD